MDRGESLDVRILDDITVRYLPTPLPAGSPDAVARFLARLPSAWRRWRTAWRDFSPEILHVQCFGPNGVYALAMHRRFRTPLVLTSHGETLADDGGAFRRSGILRLALRNAIADAAAVTAPSSFVLDDLRRTYGLVGGEVVPNGVAEVPDGDAAAAAVLRGRYLLAVGRLGWMKGFDLLIDAFAEADLDPELDLVIVGDGPERERLSARIAERGVGDRVRITGRWDPAAVAEAMEHSAGVVVPSRVEAFGIVALEAWRSGAPLVMTNRGGGPTFVRDEIDGLLVDPEDAPALGRALRRVASDEDLRTRLIAAGHQRVTEFTWAAVAGAYRNVYRTAGEQPRQTRVEHTATGPS